MRIGKSMILDITASHLAPFFPIYFWFSDTFHDNLDDMFEGMGISRRYIGKNYM